MITAGIDVGSAKKGFHAVALRGTDTLDRFTSTDSKAMAARALTRRARFDGRINPPTKPFMFETIPQAVATMG